MVKLPFSRLGVKRGGTQHKQHPRGFGNAKRKGVRLGLGAAAGAINWARLTASRHKGLRQGKIKSELGILIAG
jgi:hypothetical protein